MGDITKIEVWNISVDLAESIYRTTEEGSFLKDFSLKDQMRRSAISIPSNIAEGLESGFDKLGIRYFYNAKGSVAELKTQLLLSMRIKYLERTKYAEYYTTLESIDKMLNRLISYRKNLVKDKKKSS